MTLLLERLHKPQREPIFPVQLLREQVQLTNRRIENSWWFRPVRIDFHLPDGSLPKDALQQSLFSNLFESLQRQGHTVSFQPDNRSDMIVSSHIIGSGNGTLYDRVTEVEPPLMLLARDQFDIDDILKRNFTAVTTIDEDIAAMTKRGMEMLARRMMLNIGALKIGMIHTLNRSHPNYFALATMEGGLGVQSADSEDAVDSYRDRLVTQACAKLAGNYIEVPNVVHEKDWVGSLSRQYIAHFFRELGEWGYIDKPFEFERVTSPKRAALGKKIVGWSRQSESAGAMYDQNLKAPRGFSMGLADGLIVATMSGRFKIDKTKLQPEDCIPVAIVPRTEYVASPGDPLSLYGFNRYALGISDQPIVGPSIEFDEMAATFFTSPLVRVSRHPMGGGYRPDPDGNIWIPRVRAFIHVHQGIEAILPQPLWGVNALDLFEYVRANLIDYPYPTGCGKDIQFGSSTDAANRSIGVQMVNSSYLVVAFDTLDHGTNLLVLAAPLPGTNFIPENPLAVLRQFIHPRTGPVRLSSEIAQI